MLTPELKSEIQALAEKLGGLTKLRSAALYLILHEEYEEDQADAGQPMPFEDFVDGYIEMFQDDSKDAADQVVDEFSLCMEFHQPDFNPED